VGRDYLKEEKFMEIIMKNSTGLHARPAKELVQLCQQFDATVQLIVGEKKANTKSMLALMSLGLEEGQRFQISAEGEDATVAEQAVKDFFERLTHA
jgi:phosphotransferase system HPr (HPr) family protein